MSGQIIGDILPYTQATAILNQTVFMTNWTANVASDVVVYRTPFGSPPNDVTQILAYPSGYSVSFIGSQQEVQVTLVTPVAAGDIITITRQTPADRLNLYSNTNFTPSMLNQDFGILTLVDQQAQLVDQKVGPRYNYSATIINVIDTILPILGANQIWAMNTTRTQIIPVDLNEIISGGTVTQINTGLGLTGGPITSAGTISFGTMAANTFWGNVTGSVALPTQVPTSYFLTASNNLSDLTNAATARANLGLAIGTDVQAYSAALTSIAGLTTGTNTLIYTTGANTYSVINPANNAVLISSNTGVPSWSTTLPQAVQTNIQYLGVQNQNLNMGGFQINNGANPSQPQDFATKSYVDLNALTGTSVYATTTTNLTVTQAGSGVGATLTNAGAQATFALDGVNPPLNSIVLIKNLAAAQNEGIYTVTNVGSGATNWVLTRATTYDTPAEINNTGLIIIRNGSTLAGTAWYNSVTIVTVDVTAFSYSQFGNVIFPVSLANGGTNANLTAIAGGIVYSTSTALAISTAGTSGQFLTSGGTGAPTWTTNILPTTPGAAGNILISNGTNYIASTSLWPNTVASAGQILRSNGTTNAYSTSLFADTYAASTLLYSSGANNVVGLATGNNGVLITSNTGVPSYLAAGTTGQFLQATTGAPPSWVTTNFASATTTVTGGGIATGGGALSSNQVITVTAASKAQQIAATSAVVAVVPSVQQFHPSAVKFWVMFSWTGSVININASYNVSSVTRAGVGNYTINYTTAFTSANYSVGLAPIDASVSTAGQVISTVAGSCTVAFVAISPLAGRDPSLVSVFGFGTQ